MFATSSTTGTVQLWNFDDGQPTADLIEGLQPHSKAKFSPDGTCLAALGPGSSISLWDVSDTSSAKQVLQLSANAKRFAFSSDSKTLFVADGAGELTSFKFTATGFQEAWNKKFEHSPTALEIGPQDSVVAIAVEVNQDQTGAVWLVDANDGSLLSAVQQHPSRVKSIRFAPDRSALLYHSDFAAVLWRLSKPSRAEATTGNLYQVLAGATIDHENSLTPLAPAELTRAFQQITQSDPNFAKPPARLLRTWKKLAEKAKTSDDALSID